MKTTLRLKACLRCHGDLYQGLDGELSCLQCGYERSPRADARLLTQEEQGKRPLIAAA